MSSLLIIDVQKGFINRHTNHIPALVERKQNEYERVYITQFFNPENSFYRNLIRWDKMGKESRDFELAFIPCKQSLVIEKNQYSVVGPKFLHELKNKKTSSIDICGLETDICVLKNAIDLIENNIMPRVLTNYCASTAGPQSHDFAIKTLMRFIGKGQIIRC